MNYPSLLERKEANINIQPKEIKTDKTMQDKILRLPCEENCTCSSKLKNAALNPLEY